MPPGSISIAPEAIDNMRAHITRLYEQGAGPAGIGEYVRRWRRWATAGLGGLVPEISC